MTPLERVLERLPDAKRSGNGWSARCPAHHDRNASLSVNEGDDGKVLVNCHAGCATDAVVAAIGLMMRELFADDPVRSVGQPRIVTVYPYRDESGVVLFEVVRYDPKQFRQRRPDGNGGYVWNTKGVRLVPYRLDEMVRAVAAGKTVYVVEGEKDADRIVATGACATTSPRGAGKWSSVATEATKVLAGATVVVVADRDEPGRRHAADVATSLTGVAASVVVLQAATGKDVADHLAAGYTLDQLVPIDLDDEPEPEANTKSATNLPATFWQARPVLAHIRQASHHRARSADAVLGAVLARVAAMTPPTVTLPAVVGSRASLNVFHGIVGPSGAGKSTAVKMAEEVCPWPMGDHVRRIKPSSGEGLVEAYFSTVTEDGKRVKRQTRDRLLVDIDEGQALLEMGNRKGNILLPILREAWTGNDLGQSGASSDTTRELQGHTYRMAVVIGLQLRYAAEIVGDDAGGTPQRFVWFTATDPEVPYDPPPWPGPLDINPPPAGEMDLHPDIAHELRRQNVAASRGDVTPDPLDSHANLVRLKLAGLLAILDNRRSINPDDWALADTIWTTSTTMRDRIIAAGRNATAQREAQFTERAVRQHLAVTDSAERRALDGMAKAIARRVHRGQGPTSRREVVHATKHAWRQLVALDDAIAEAEAHGWIVPDGDRWRPGGSRPS